MTTIHRTVSFYWIRQQLHDNLPLRPVEDFDWKKRLQNLNDKPWDEKEIDDVHYDVILNNSYPILTVLESFDPAFMRVIDAERKTVVDYMNKLVGTDSARLANSSAVAFFPDHSLVAHVSSTPTIKSTKPIVNCLNHYWPSNEYKWCLEPVVAKDSLQRFHDELEQVTSFEVSFPTQPDLFSSEVAQQSIVEFFREVSRSVGDELKVSVKVSLTEQKGIRSVGRRLKDVVSDFIPYVAERGTKANIKGITGQQFNEALLDLNLVNHRIVESSSIEIQDGNSLRFSELIEHLIDVCASQQDRLYEINRSRNICPNAE